VARDSKGEGEGHPSSIKLLRGGTDEEAVGTVGEKASLA